MTQLAMNVETVTTARHLKFHIYLNSPDVIDLFAFVLIVSARFYGTISRVKRWPIRPEEYFASIDLKFSNAVQWTDARKFCQNHLDEDGHVKSHYREALDAFDPGRSRSQELLSRAMPVQPQSDTGSLSAAGGERAEAAAAVTPKQSSGGATTRSITDESASCSYDKPQSSTLDDCG